MAVASADEFFAVLEKSNLLEPEQLAEAQGKTNGDMDPTSIARTLVRQDLITRWQAGQLLAGRSSFFLGKYKLIELLGRGGMGSVFLAQHTMMNRRVALKILSRQFGKDPDALERFFSEARAAAALDHPNIVQAYSVDNEGDRYFIVMEYIDGRNLQQWVEAEGPLDCESAVDCIRQAAEGLAHGHQQKIIHCDIKPSNLLVNSQGTVKIVDMGLTRLTGQDGDDDAGQDDRVLGSVDYLAPEQALETPDFDHRADIYALGCTLYFLLTGRPPFPEGTIHQRIMKHQTQEPQDIRELRPEVPEDLAEICRKMMARRPEDRFQSAEEVGMALSRWRPPVRKPKRVAAPKRPVPNGGVDGLSLIDVGEPPKPAAARPATKKEEAKKDAPARLGLFSTRRRKVIGAAIAASVVILAVAVPLLIASSGNNGQGESPQSQTSHEQPEEKSPAPEEKTTPVKEPDETGETPAVEPEPSISEPEPQPEPEPQTEPEPEPQPEPEPEPQPEPEPEPQPEPEPEPQPEPEPEPQPEPEPEPEPEPKREPFRSLAAAADLPILESGADADPTAKDPFPLGDLYVDSDSRWDIELIGGKAAVKGTKQFVLQRDDTEGNSLAWLVQLETIVRTGADGEKTDVARIWHENDRLMFQWLDTAEPMSANALRNCALNIRADGEERLLPLTPLAALEPLVIDFERGIATTRLRRKWLPDVTRLRLEITKWDGNFPNHVVQPQGPVAPRTPINVVFERQDRNGNMQQMMLYRIDFTTRSTELTVGLRQVEPSPKTLNFRGFQGLNTRNQLEVARDQLQQQLDKVKKDSPQKMALERSLVAMNMQIWFADQYLALHKQGKIQFRVYLEPEEGTQQIDLINTELFQEEAADDGE